MGGDTRAELRSFLISDIEGSSRLWERDPGGMERALARHDALSRDAVARQRGALVKTTGDGVLAAFEDPYDALAAALQLQLGLAQAQEADGPVLSVRCGLHVGVVERRDNDFFGNPVNRAARIMSAAHGGQTLLSHAMAELVRDRLPPPVALIDLGEHRLRDLARPERLYQLGHPELRRTFPALRTQEAMPDNLPRQRTQFIGRERELTECARLLGEVRLLALTGVGGCGKTRLAVRLAQEPLACCPDGVCFVDLAPVDNDALLADVIATALGAVVEVGPESPLGAEDAIVAFLDGRRALLLLDNCEHLLGAVASLVDRLLAALPELRIVATTREALGVEGEHAFPVRSLGMPKPADADDPDALLRTEAVRLFVARACDAGTEFALDRTNAGFVVEICRRLDGIPLAIELAAARTRALSVADIARMLDDRFRLLTGGSRGAVERHRTLRATVQWSYDHLDAGEQVFFSALAVFAGGWTLDAAACVTDRDTFDALDGLTRLIDKSLVVAEGHGATASRYRMLETLRQFGLEVLATCGRADGVRKAHLRCFLGLVRGMEDALRDAFPIATVDRLEADVDNLRAALTWGYAHDPASAVELTRRLLRLWSRPGYYEEGRRWYGRTLELGDAVAPADRADAHAGAGRLAFQQGRYDVAFAHYEEAIALHRASGNERELGLFLIRCGTLHTYRRRHDEARRAFDEARRIVAGLDDSALVATLDNSIGIDAVLRGEFAEARRCFESVLETYRPHGDLNRIQVTLGNLAQVDLAEGNVALARSHLHECLGINRRLRNLYGIGHWLPALAEILRLERDPVVAARIIGATDALLDRIGAALEELERASYERVVAALRDELGDQAFEDARRAGRAMSWEEAIALAGA